LSTRSCQWRTTGQSAGLTRFLTSGAVFWQAGEEHETKTEAGLTALIIEGDGLEPFRQPE
jgi:hypothetical protein